MCQRFFLFALLFVIHVTGASIPHCTTKSVMEGTVREYDFNANPTIRSSTQLTMKLGDTACLQIGVQNSSIALHIIRYSKLLQTYPVAGNYTFGIPFLNSYCLCECPNFKSCTIENYKYRKCQGGALCYRTYHYPQSSHGCASEGQSKACCEIRIDVHENRTYEALELAQPNTAALLDYIVYDWLGDRWSQKPSTHEKIKVLITHGISRAELSTKHHRLRILLASNRPFREVGPGMYYVESGRQSVYGHVALNAGGETSLEKLGWFRLWHGRWDIRRGGVQMQEAHNVHFTKCKEQTYIEQFHASYFASPEKRTSDLKLGRRLSSNAWVRKAVYSDRAVTLEHGEGVAITFTIHTETRPKVFYDGSHFEHFEGFIHMDEHSNRFLHITFYEARGTILGIIYSDKKKTASLERIHLQVDYGRNSNYTTRILIPSSVNGTRYVCFYPEGDVDKMSCQWLAFRVEDLKKESENTRLHERQGTVIPGLNEESDDILTKIWRLFGSSVDGAEKGLDVIATNAMTRFKALLTDVLIVISLMIVGCFGGYLFFSCGFRLIRKLLCPCTVFSLNNV